MSALRDTTERDAIRARYGVNGRVAGAWDEALAAHCQNGVFVGSRRGETLAFLGVPFAQPPVGEKRWKRAEPVLPSEEVYEALYNGKTPIQTEWPTEQASYYPQGEDCLYLNVWTGPDRTQTGKPVMVFFHGGSYGWGGTADPLYDGENFVTAHPEIVLITVGYRVGLMGFVDFSSVPGGEAFSDAPNLGLLDQIEALRWVRANAKAFGGDPDCVTIFGESAGGGSVSLLPLIPEARGLFRRVIAESGSVALTYSREECQDFTRRLLKASKAASMDALMALSEEDLKTINKKLNVYNNFPQRDGVLIPENPYLAYARGDTAGIDMIHGTNQNESNYWIGEIGGIAAYRFSIPVKFENDLMKLSAELRQRVLHFMRIQKGHSMWRMTEFYNEVMFRLPAIRQAESHSRQGGKAYLYYWTEPSARPFMGACHAVELAYVFGNVQNVIYTGKPADTELSRKVMDYWAHFALTGEPGEDWPAYTEERRDTMVLSRDCHVEQDILKDQREELNPLLDVFINASYATLEYNVPFMRKAVLKVLLILGLLVWLIVWLLNGI